MDFGVSEKAVGKMDTITNHVAVNKNRDIFPQPVLLIEDVVLQTAVITENVV